MAAISITAASVLPVTSSNPTILTGVAGATITQNQPLYIDASGTLQLADSNDASKYQVVGLSLNSALSGQQVSYLTRGTITMGSTQLAGDDIWLFTTAGTMTVTKSDVASGSYNVHIGTYLTTTTALINITIGGLVA